MRVVRKILEEIPKTDNRRRTTAMLDDLQTQLDEIKKLDPAFTYVYRVLARQHERKQEFQKVLDVLNDYERVSQLDYDLRNMRVRAMLRMSEDKDNPQPGKIDEAADYVAKWFSSGSAPLFAESLAASSTWMVDNNFRKAILKRYAALYQAQPKNINLVISYACALYVAGKNESTWKLMHEAEQIGLCDDVIGGRHPPHRFLGNEMPGR